LTLKEPFAGSLKPKEKREEKLFLFAWFNRFGKGSVEEIISGAKI